MTLTDLFFCIYNACVDNDNGTNWRDSFQKVSFDWIGHSWNFYVHKKEYYSIDAKLKTEGETFCFYLKSDFVKEEYKDKQLTSICWGRDIYPLVIMLLKLGDLTSSKVLFEEEESGESRAALLRNKLHIKIQKEDEGWLEKVTNSIYCNEKIQNLIDEEFRDKFLEIVTQEKVFPHPDCNKLLPKDLYVIENYDIEEFIESGDYLEVYDYGLNRGEVKDLQHRQKSVVNQWDDNWKRYGPGCSDVERLWPIWAKDIWLAFLDEINREEEDSSDMMGGYTEELCQYNTLSKVVSNLLPDLKEELRKCFEKCYKKNPFECQKAEHDNDNSIQFREWITESKYFKRFIEDCIEDVEPYAKEYVLADKRGDDVPSLENLTWEEID